VEERTLTTMFSVNQTRGKRSIPQLTYHEMPIRVH